MPAAFTPLLLIGTLVSSAVQAQAPSPAAPPPPERLAALIDSAATDAVARHLTPAVSIGVSRGGRTIYAKGFGWADLENQVQATAETVYQIGSITKQFTAAAILQLVEQGKLSLDDRLTRFFPDWPAPGNQVTIRQLLNHTSGIKSYTGLGPRWRNVIQRLPLSHDSLIATFEHEPFDFAPGTEYRYNNSAYYLLGVVVEKVSGEGYAEYLARHVTGLQGLRSTSYCDPRALIPHRARGYVGAQGEFRNADYIDMATPFAAGALCSTVGHLLAWTRALEGGRVVQPESYRLMTSPVPLPNGKPQSYGFGLGVGEFQRHKIVSHNGGIDGFRSQKASYPDDSLIVVVLANNETDLPDRLEKTITRWALELPVEPPQDVPIAAADLARLAGAYGQADQGIRIFPEDGRLMLQLPGDQPSRLRNQGGNRFVLESNPDFQVTFQGSGKVPDHLLVTVPGGTQVFPRRP